MIYVGTKLYGYCNGYFGDSYDDKRIEAVGCDWMVVRDIDLGIPRFACFRNSEEIENFVKEHSIKDDEPEWEESK